MTAASFSGDELDVEPHGLVIKKEVKRKWVSYIWDTFDKSPEERRFLFKLDAALLTLASLGLFATLYVSSPSR
jgi:MFS transporter, ACS family, pantothenate transporter